MGGSRVLIMEKTKFNEKELEFKKGAVYKLPRFLRDKLEKPIILSFNFIEQFILQNLLVFFHLKVVQSIKNFINQFAI